MNVLKILNIKPTEAKPILMLIAYSFFMGLSIAFYFTATISDFLTHFDVTILPYTYILSGILGYLLWLIWSFLEKKIRFTSRLLLGISFLVITVAIQGIGILYFYQAWISFVMLVWVRVFIFVNMVNFWGMAGKMFNLGQGKRLFGIISIGTVISDIFGFFSIPFILLLGINNPGLILIAIITLIICLLITFQITRIFKDQLGEKQLQSVEIIEASKNEPFFKSKYHYYLFSLAILPMFGFYFVDYLFLDQVQNEFKHSAEALAGFMGIFFGVVAVFELLIKSSVFSRLINNFGLKVALLALPGILLITVLLTITVGVAAGSFGFLFSMIAFIKLLEKVLRSGVNDPSFQILYQPIPSQDRLAFQSKMEGIPTALGNVMAGVLLLVLIFFDLTSPILFNAIFFLVLVFWCYMAFTMQKEYRNVIVNNLSDLNQQSTVENELPENHSGLDIERLKGKSEEDIFQTILFFQNFDPKNTKKQLQLLKDHPSDKVREAVLNIQRKQDATTTISKQENGNGQKSEGKNGLEIVQPEVNKPSRFENSIHASVQEMLYADKLDSKLKLLEHIKQFENKDQTKKIIEKLILDDQPEVVSGALELIAMPLNQAYANLIVQSLENMPLSYLADSLLNTKNAIVEKLLIKKLQQLESGQWYDMKAQLLSIQIIRILGNIGEMDAQNYLVKLLDFGPSEIKYFAALALDKTGYRAEKEDEVFFIQLIEKEVAFCTWVIASRQDLMGFKKGTDALIECLKDEYLRSTEKIIAFLSFLYSRITVQQISANLRSASTEKNVLGSEMCELLFSNTLKSILAPIYSSSSSSERLKVLIKEYPQQRLNPIQRLENILYHDFTKVNTWLKILAMDIISKNVTKVPKELFANLHIKNPVVKESSYLAIHRIDPEEFQKRIRNEFKDYRLHFDKLLGTDPALGKTDSIFESIVKLKELAPFKNLYEIILMKLAVALVKIDLSAEHYYCNKYGNARYIHFVTDGKFHLVNSENEKTVFKKGDVIGLFEAFNLQNLAFEADDETQMLAVEAGYFFQLVSIYDELLKAVLAYRLELNVESVDV